MSKKHLQPIIFFITFILIGGGIWYVWTKRLSEWKTQGSKVVVKPTIEKATDEKIEKNEYGRGELHTTIEEALNSQDWETYQNEYYGYSFAYPQAFELFGNNYDKLSDTVDYTYFYRSVAVIKPGDKDEVILDMLINDAYGHGNDTLSYAKNFWAEEDREKYGGNAPGRINYDNIVIGNVSGIKLSYTQGGKTVIHLFFPLKKEKYLIIAASYETAEKRRVIYKIINTLRID